MTYIDLISMDRQQIHVFNIELDRYSWGPYSVPGMVLGTEGSAMNMAEKASKKDCNPWQVAQALPKGLLVDLC